MEMVEGRNISPKWIKFREMMEKREEDRISALPDCLIIEILSHLPSTKYAIRTCTLSKRWKDLWTWVHTLIFTSDHDPYTQYPQSRNSRSKFVSSVNKTLTQHRQLNLKKFEVNNRYYPGFEFPLNKWIRYAISHNVEEFNLKLSSTKEKFLLDQSFFINTCFTDLTLSRCLSYPIGAISWKKLKRLCISFEDLDEVLMEKILSGSPLLETLVLNDCHGHKRLNITSKSIKSLVVDDCSYRDMDDFVEINAPNMLSLTVKGCLMFRNILLVNVSSLVKVNLDYIKRRYKETTYEEEIFKGLLLNLRHVKELNIRGSCSKVVSRLEAKGFVIPSNIKFPDGVHQFEFMF